jgi:hypothetical protein
LRELGRWLFLRTLPPREHARRARTRSTIAAVLFVSGLSGCSSDQAPTESYQMPTAIIGIATQSDADASTIFRTFHEFARQHGLILMPKYPDLSVDRHCGKPPGVCSVWYEPPYPRLRRGFSSVLEQLSERCFDVRLSEYSGTWTRYSLQAIQDLQKRLADATGAKVALVVHPKASQNWAAQISPGTLPDPEVPETRGHICIRLGLPDPGVP